MPPEDDSVDHLAQAIVDSGHMLSGLLASWANVEVNSLAQGNGGLLGSIVQNTVSFLGELIREIAKII